MTINAMNSNYCFSTAILSILQTQKISFLYQHYFMFIVIFAITCSTIVYTNYRQMQTREKAAIATAAAALHLTVFAICLTISY